MTNVLIPFSDDAKRLSGEVRTHIVADKGGHWIPVRLRDAASPTHEAYPTHADAVRATGNDSHYYAFLKIPYDAMPPMEAERWLVVVRKIYDAGFRVTDPETPQIVMPRNLEDLRSAVAALKVKR